MWYDNSTYTFGHIDWLDFIDVAHRAFALCIAFARVVVRYQLQIKFIKKYTIQGWHHSNLVTRLLIRAMPKCFILLMHLFLHTPLYRDDPRVIPVVSTQSIWVMAHLLTCLSRLQSSQYLQIDLTTLIITILQFISISIIILIFVGKCT